VWEFKQIKDLHLRIVAPHNLFTKFIHKVCSMTRLPIGRTWKVFEFVKDLKGFRLSGRV